MKKTLIALAAVAATSAAFAQSSVTIYGKVDVGVARSIGSTVTELKQAAGSRLGFRGAEDLGGGLKANFHIEHRFNPDTGVDSTFNPGGTNATTGVVTPASSVMWQGRSFVGLQGGFGKLDLGRDYAAAFWTALAGDVYGYDGVASNASIASAGTQTARFGNLISYTTPNMAGLTAQLSLSLKEAGAKNGTSFRLAYANGPIAASLATEKGLAGQKYTGVGASYNFGAATVNALISKGETAAGVESDGVLFGVVVPLGAVSLKASYGTLEVGGTKTVQQLGLGMRYALSKRTDVYTSLANNSKRTTNKSGVELGIQHNF